MQQRLCFGAGDINNIVKTMPQSEILREIRLAIIVLSDELPEAIQFYWKDRLEAYRLAYAISEWYDGKLITPVLELKSQIDVLREKQYKNTIPSISVKGGIPIV